MKKAIIISTVVFLVITGCKGNKESIGDLITVDITKNYPSKELILQDFMDMEYIELETSDEFVTQGVVYDVGKEIIVVMNPQSDDGNIYIFSRDGKGLRIINHKGQGPGEYRFASSILLDEENNEMFLFDPTKGILVFDLFGNFMRSFLSKELTRLSHIYNYDKDNLICLDESYFSTNSESTSPILILSKSDGKVNRDIQIPFIQRAPKGVQVRTDNGGWMMTSITNFCHSLIPYRGDWIVTTHSSDTVYQYLSDHSKHPLIVRTPPSQSMEGETFLFPGIMTDRYYFMMALNEDIGATSPWSGIPNHPLMASTNIVYDKQDRILSELTVYNSDYSDKRKISMFQRTADNDEIAFWYTIDAYQLIDDYKKGVLNGRLKEIAANFDEEDNPIIVLVKYKESK